MAFENLPFLSLLIFLPIIGAIFIACMPFIEKDTEKNMRHVALFISLLTFFISLLLWWNFDPKIEEFQYTEVHPWILGTNICYYLGVDGISILFIVLTTLLVPLCFLASWSTIKISLKEFLIAFLFLETFIIGTFCSLDLVLFYLFFEGSLIPMFFIIGIWGGEQRIYASFKFFLYTLAGSVLMLLALLYIYFETGTSNISSLSFYPFPVSTQIWLWLAFFASFAVKIPMWPFHTWLPDAHVEAPTAGSVILAGILLKLGGYGFLRISLPFFPDACHFFAPYVWGLSIIAIIYTSLIALAQKDIKKLIAYSSIAHMGYVTLGIFMKSIEALQGAVLQMISHGLISAGLFLSVGILYERKHSREISHYGGLALSMPSFAVIFMILTLGSIGLPGTSGFIGEFLVLISTFQVNSAIALLASTGIVLSAAYMLWLYKRLIFGKAELPSLQLLKDLTIQEKIIFVPLLVGIIWIGFYPSSFTVTLEKSLTSLSQILHKDKLLSDETNQNMFFYSFPKRDSI